VRAESIPTTPIGYWWLEGERGSSGVRKLWYWAVIAAGEIRPNRVGRTPRLPTERIGHGSIIMEI